MNSVRFSASQAELDCTILTPRSPFSIYIIIILALQIRQHRVILSSVPVWPQLKINTRTKINHVDNFFFVCLFYLRAKKVKP